MIVAVRDILRKYPVVAYDEANNTGDLKHIIVRTRLAYEASDDYCNENKGAATSGGAIVRHYSGASEVVSIVQNIQPKPTNVIMGRETKLLGRRTKRSCSN